MFLLSRLALIMENGIVYVLKEFPLRIIVDSKYVGAIIGTSGSNIREITKETKARVVVDVQRTMKDSQGHSEKASDFLMH